MIVSLTDGFHASTEPLPGSTAARYVRELVPTVVNLPPRYRRWPSGETASERTVPFAPGFHPLITWPVAASIAATRCRDCPLTLEKLPATYTVLPITAIALTRPLVVGLQASRTSPVVASIAASFPRVFPLTDEKSPPAYTRDPSGETARACTMSLALGAQPGTTTPVVASNAARRVRATELPPEGDFTCVNVPPR